MYNIVIGLNTLRMVKIMTKTRKLTAFLLAASLCSAVSCSSDTVGNTGISQNTASVTDIPTEPSTEPTTEPAGSFLKGNFYDTNGILLTYSEEQPDSSVRRKYAEEFAEPFANIITEMSDGYDTAFNDILNEENPTPSAENKVGKSIQLTLDANVQKSIYDYMKEQNIVGSVVVLRSDGSILSQVSYPSYDPNAVKDQKYDEKLAWGDCGNKAFQNYEPGSCFKIMSAVLADKHGIYSQYDEGEWDFGGMPIVNWDHETNKTGYPTQRSLYSAILNSSNIFFAKTFGDIGKEDVLADLSSIFHFGADEKDDIVCDFGTISNNVEIYCNDDLYRTAFGQSYVLTCPIFLAALGREAIMGDMVRPFVLQNIVDTSDGKTVIGEGSKPCDVIATIPEDYRQSLLDGMMGVASDIGVYISDDYTFYAKTGTAETWVNDFLYITGFVRNNEEKPNTKYTDYSNYSDKGSYSVVMQIQNPAEHGLSFASESAWMYREIVNLAVGLE